MQCKGDTSGKMAPKLGLFFPGNKWPKIPFILELKASKLVSKDLSSLSYIIYRKGCPVVLAHKATENLK